MDLGEYFDKTQGHGVLSTADSSGVVDAAIYARPHLMEANTVAFVMAERLTHKNLQSNPHAVYLFIEAGQGYQGKRLYLTKTKEESLDELVEQICRRCDYSMHGNNLTRHVVFFHVDKVLPLIGAGC
ncbi:MAG: pyridoxamine 5'-phosphate oxidase family protein [Dehalococcoidia bacterium]|nr:pyridoxamine 5'-phosphate oxidase family protein [Dehalococcoidia bacterium]